MSSCVITDIAAGDSDSFSDFRETVVTSICSSASIGNSVRSDRLSVSCAAPEKQDNRAIAAKIHLRLHEGLRFINSRLSEFSKLHADTALPQSFASASQCPKTQPEPRVQSPLSKYCPLFDHKFCFRN